MKVVDSYLAQLVQAGGSDLHLASGVAPMVRVHGQLDALPLPPLENNQVQFMLDEILDPMRRQIFQDESHVDFVYRMDNPQSWMNRFRCNAFVQKNGVNIVFRGIGSHIPTLKDLGLPDILAHLTHHHHGLVLVVGPAGCGKTSTLAALVRYINETRATHVITIEDPIEYVFQNQRAMVVQRQVGDNVDSFATALRASLREDPDVIVVAEMRDLETISMAISAAETGHLVLGTLHTRSAVQTVQRMIDSFPTNQQAQIRTMLSESLRGVICQQLVPRADGKGRVVAYELLLVGGSIANLIREGKDFQLPNAMQMGRAKGMRMMDDSLKELAQKQWITGETAVRMAHDTKAVSEAVGYRMQTGAGVA
jgi:twitching motility protein PilT